MINSVPPNNLRYNPASRAGHYESYFLRANHPSRPLAFWIRYTIFSPDNRPEKALAEVWAIWFDAERKKHVAAKNEIPLVQAVFSSDPFFIKIDTAELNESSLSGLISGTSTIEWQLHYASNEPPVFVLDRTLYHSAFPKAKLLVAKPMALFHGTLRVKEEIYQIENWKGSQNHNWGVKHTDHYAWGQVAGFDNAPDSFFEVATARLKIGPFWTPFMTVMVLRHQGREYRLNTVMQALKAKASFSYFTWQFDSRTPDVHIQGIIESRADDFVGLRYYNPPGGIKYCLNSKIASCRITLTKKEDRVFKKQEVLETSSRAAFEILTDDRNHGITLSV